MCSSILTSLLQAPGPPHACPPLAALYPPTPEEPPQQDKSPRRDTFQMQRLVPQIIAEIGRSIYPSLSTPYEAQVGPTT
jgi:hypothetical protein